MYLHTFLHHNSGLVQTLSMASQSTSFPPISSQQGRENGLTIQQMGASHTCALLAYRTKFESCVCHPQCAFSSCPTSRPQYTLCSLHGSDLLITSRSAHLPVRMPSLLSLPGHSCLYLVQGHLFLCVPYAFLTPTYTTPSLSHMALFCTNLFCSECPV